MSKETILISISSNMTILVDIYPIFIYWLFNIVKNKCKHFTVEYGFSFYVFIICQYYSNIILISDQYYILIAMATFYQLLVKPNQNQFLFFYFVFLFQVLPRREKRQYKKRKHKSLGSGRSGGADSLGVSSDEDVPMPQLSPETTEEPQDDEGQFAFRRNKSCSYHMVRNYIHVLFLHFG